MATPALLSSLRSRFDVPFAIQPKATPELIPTGLAQIGIPRGTLTEIHGPASSGRTAILHSTLAHATANPECCALIDTTDSFDPRTAASAGVRLPWLLWIRCGGSAENALKAVDLVIQAGGFGVVAFDLAGVSAREARRIPLASWFRLRNAVEKTSTALLVLSEELNAHSCSTLQIATATGQHRMQGKLLREVAVTGTLGPRARGCVDFTLQPFYSR